jgi:hypothetical protein
VKTSRVLVFRSFQDLGPAWADYKVFVCSRPDGGRYLLAFDSVPPRGDQALVTALRVAGDYVAAAFASGMSGITDCEKNLVLFPPPPGTVPCPGPTYSIRVANARTGQSAALRVSDVDSDAGLVVGDIKAGAPAAIMLHGAGAIAWIDDRELLATRFHPRGKRLRGSPKVLDPHPSGLVSLTGRIVNWYDVVNGAQVNHTATLS